MLSNIWVNIVSGNGLAPNDTAPLTDPTPNMLNIVDKWCPRNIYKSLTVIRIITANTLEMIYDNHFYRGQWVYVFDHGTAQYGTRHHIPWDCQISELTSSVNITIICSDNGFSHVRHQAIIWTNDYLLSIGSSGTDFSEIWLKFPVFIHKFFWIVVCYMSAILTRPRLV